MFLDIQVLIQPRIELVATPPKKMKNFFVYYWNIQEIIKNSLIKRLQDGLQMLNSSPV